jgi:hypothetical protein
MEDRGWRMEDRIEVLAQNLASFRPKPAAQRPAWGANVILELQSC